MLISVGLVTKSSLLLLKANQAFFFFFLGMDLPDDKLGAWLDDDGFDKKVKADKAKSYLFDELLLAKSDFKAFLDSNNIMNSVISNQGGARIVQQYIQANIIRIKKIRLMISFKTYFNITKNAYGTRYIAAKSCWIGNKDGKVSKKFAVLVGLEDEIKEKGVIPNRIKKQVEKDLEALMWEKYQREYKKNKTI